MARERIISADSHVTIRDAAILERLPARHHDAYRAGKLLDADRGRRAREPGPKHRYLEAENDCTYPLGTLP